MKRSPLPRPTFEQAIAWDRKQREKARKRARPKPTRKAKQDQRELDEARAIVLARSGGWCEGAYLVGVHPHYAHAANHVHHVLSRARGGSHDPSNLLHLCGAVHEWAHRNPAEATKLGLLKSRVSYPENPPNSKSERKVSGPNGETMIVLPMKPRDAWYVRCPKCGLIGWQNDDGPMYCPDDLALAERFEETSARG